MMHHAEHIAAIRREGAALAAAARAAGLDAEIASCPGWTIADLLAHVGRIHRWVTELVVMRPKPPDGNWRGLEEPPAGTRIEWFDDGYRRFADALADVPAGAEVWTWSGDHTAAFWSRRQAHELAIHRWDAQGATGEPEPVDRALAVDGIQEVFDILPARPGVPPVTGAGETIHLHCTDGDGEWLVRLTPDGPVVTNEHAKGDVAARGTASDLLLLVWGRIQPERLQTFGDASLLARWQAATRF
jgi:uncharacterized protein (TIGR03083 family)